MRPPRAASGLAAALAALAALLAAAPPAPAQPVGSGVGGVVLRQVGAFDNPTYVAQPPGNRRLLFVTEQAGMVRVIHRGRTLARPFLDLRGRTTCGAAGSDTCGERGLLSIAFPPDYARSRRFYVYYTALDGAIQVDEYRRARRDPTLALPASRRSVLTIPHSRFPNHNGGQLQFHGRELLLGTGDGGGGGDTSATPRTPARCSASCCVSTRARPGPGGPMGFPAPTRSSAGPAATRSSATACATRTGSASRRRAAGRTGS